MQLRIAASLLVRFCYDISPLAGIISKSLQAGPVDNVIILISLISSQRRKTSLHNMKIIKPEENRTGIPYMQKSLATVLSDEIGSIVTRSQAGIIHHPAVNVRTFSHHGINLTDPVPAGLDTFLIRIGRIIL